MKRALLFKESCGNNLIENDGSNEQILQHENDFMEASEGRRG